MLAVSPIKINKHEFRGGHHRALIIQKIIADMLQAEQNGHRHDASSTATVLDRWARILHAKPLSDTHATHNIQDTFKYIWMAYQRLQSQLTAATDKKEKACFALL